MEAAASWSTGLRSGFMSPEEATLVGETGPRPPCKEGHTAGYCSPSPEAAWKGGSAPQSPGLLGARRPEPALGLGPPPLLFRPLAVALVNLLSCSTKPRPTSHRHRGQPTSPRSTFFPGT